MAGIPVVDSLVEMLTTKAVTLVIDEVTLLWGLEKEVDKLAKALRQIHAMLGDAGGRQHSEKAVQEWLEDLKEISLEADDVLDEFNTRAALWRQKEEATKEHDAQGGDKEASSDRLRRAARHLRLACCFGASSVPPSYNIPFRHKIASTIEAINGAVAGLEQRGRTLQLARSLSGTSTGTENSSSKRPETSSLPVEQFFGRDRERECIIQTLLSCADHDSEGTGPKVALVPIVAMGGTGKTALAQAIFNDGRVESHFSPRKWLSVGERFDAKSLIEAILGETQGAKSLEDLHHSLIRVLDKKRFLLVLDDVWCEQGTEWEQLWAPLHQGGHGSKVLLTTRHLKVARAMGSVDVHQLEPMSDEDCWSIFEKHAFRASNPRRDPRLEEIGRQIVRKLKGVPLAAKIVGGMLGDTEGEQEWRRVMENEIWLSQDQGEGLMEQVVGLSYQRLQPHLKQCFAYCSLLPKDSRYDETRLVQMWMAQCLIHPKRSNERLEEVGSDCFKNLLQRSLLQCVQGQYVMHDIVHDLAQSVFQSEGWNMGEKRYREPEKLRHLSFSCSTTESTGFENMSDKFQRLRSLVHSCDYSIISFHQLPPLEMLFDKLRCIRVLDLKGCSVEDLPDSIGHLIHLRYLDLTTTGVHSLPEAIRDLYNLQTLRVDDRCSLPIGASCLVNLRCLVAGSGALAGVPRIGRLTSLQELKAFNVRQEDGYKIVELSKMAQLRGTLCIGGLENVVGGKAEAATAMLDGKEHLESLALEWGGDDEDDDERQDRESKDVVVLEALRPHPTLKSIKISKNRGARPPSWMEMGTVSKLVSVHLEDCPQWTSLPPLGALCCLQSLKIGGMKNVKAVGREFYGTGRGRRNSTGDGPFPCLRELEFYSMPQWEEWSEPQESPDRLAFSSLRTLHMRGCPKLRVIPLLPSSVVELTIDEVGFGVLSSFTDEVNQLGGPSRRSLTSLKSIVRRHSSALGTLTIGGYNADLAALLSEGAASGSFARLKTLTIRDCSGLTAWPDAVSKSLAVLSRLELVRVPHLTSLPEAALRPLMALQFLYIDQCEQLASVGLQALFSLSELSICSCSALAPCPEGSRFPSAPLLEKLETSVWWLIRWVLPQKLTSLKTLFIWRCTELVSFSREEEEGLACLASLSWFRVMHCPNLTVVPSGMRELPSLTYMEVVSCPIAGFPEVGFPLALTSMYIADSWEIIEKVCLGIEREKYSHIPRIFWPQ